MSFVARISLERAGQEISLAVAYDFDILPKGSAFLALTRIVAVPGNMPLSQEALVALMTTGPNIINLMEEQVHIDLLGVILQQMVDHTPSPERLEENRKVMAEVRARSEQWAECLAKDAEEGEAEGSQHVH